MKNCVSIIIPIYNAAPFIVDCLQSVVEQTFKGNIECILVDDCGTDNSIELAENFITDTKQHPSITFQILHQCENRGPSAARNRGIFKATGDYILFLDADDTLATTCVESLYNKALEFDLDYVQGTYSGDTNKFAKAHILDKNSLILDKGTIKRTLLNYNIIPFTPHNKLIRRQMLLDHNLVFNEGIKVREDFLWMTFVAKYVERFGYCPKETYIRGINNDSLTHNIDTEREIKGYRVLIETMCDNLDPFLVGEQKELILSALIMCLNAGYYHNREEKRHLVGIVKKQNNLIENFILSILLNMKQNIVKTKLLHALIRFYKL